MKMNRNLLFGAVTALLVVLSARSDAHFLWAEIRETPSRHVAIELAEVPGDSVVAAVNKKSDLVKPVPSSLKYQLAANAKDFGGPVPTNQKVVGAAMDYGLLDRGGAPYKLRYFAKGVQKLGDASSQLNLAVELVAKAAGEDIIVTALQNGKPVAKAEITYFFPEMEGVKGETDKSGNYLLAGGAKESVAVMVKVEEKAKGTIGGKSYDLMRSYSTLVIGKFSEQVEASDSPAYNTLRAAAESRETFPSKLLGFQMEIDADVNGKSVKGSFSYDAGTGVAAQLQGDEESKKWVEGQIKSIVMHRNGGRFEDGDGAHEMEFTGSENALGKQILVKDPSKTRYRVRDGQILEVERNMGTTRLFVSVLESIATNPGKTLATEMTVSSFDMSTGALKSSSLITDAFAATDGVWLPTKRSVVQTDKEGSIVRTISFKSPKLALK